MKYKLVMIKWRDAQSHDEWSALDEHTGELPVITSVGFLLRTTKDAYVLAQNIDDTNDTVSMVMTVPKAWCIGRPKSLK